MMIGEKEASVKEETNQPSESDSNQKPNCGHIMADSTGGRQI